MAAKTVPPPALRELVADYLRMRRALGFKLEGTERLLFAFVDYLHDQGASSVSVEHAVAFATSPEGASPRWQALRLSAIRRFTRWARLLDPSVQVPPARLLPARPTRAAPYLYTDAEIVARCRSPTRTGDQGRHDGRASVSDGRDRDPHR